MADEQIIAWPCPGDRYTVRATPIRQLLLDDIDLAVRRIRIAGTTHRLTDLTYISVVSRLEFRHRH